MILSFRNKKVLTYLAAILMCCAGFANENLYRQARTLQREGKHDEAIETYKNLLAQPVDEDNITVQQVKLYTEALMQLMNTFQSKGEPEACIEALRGVFKASPMLQNQCLRDYYSVLAYALSRTERMDEAEETMMKALTLPLSRESPERCFRD